MIFIENEIEVIPVEREEVDISCLSVGMTVKNYREMCRLIQEEEKNGNSKKAQLKEWHRYFGWTKEKQKFIITEIYDHPRPKEDKRSDGNRAIYVRYIELELMHYLANTDGYSITLTMRRWWQKLGMVNSRYAKIPFLELEAMNPSITDYHIRWYYQRSDIKMREILRNALNSMQDRALIMWRKQTLVMQSKERGGWFVATDAEDAEILKVKRAVLKEMGYTKERQVYYAGKQEHFYNTVNGLLKEKHGWDGVYTQIKIVYNQENMCDAISETEMEIQKNLLNEKVAAAIDLDAEKKYEKNREQYLDGETVFRLPDQYIEIQKELTRMLILLVDEDERKNTVYDYLNEDHPEIDTLFAC